MLPLGAAPVLSYRTVASVIAAASSRRGDCQASAEARRARSRFGGQRAVIGDPLDRLEEDHFARVLVPGRVRGHAAQPCLVHPVAGDPVEIDRAATRADVDHALPGRPTRFGAQRRRLPVKVHRAPDRNRERLRSGRPTAAIIGRVTDVLKQKEPEDQFPDPPASELRRSGKNATVEPLARASRTPSSALHGDEHASGMPATAATTPPTTPVSSSAPGISRKPRSGCQVEYVGNHGNTVLKSRPVSVDPAAEDGDRGLNRIRRSPRLGPGALGAGIGKSSPSPIRSRPSSRHRLKPSSCCRVTLAVFKSVMPSFSPLRQTDFAQQAADQVEHPVAFGHARDQVRQVVGVAEPEQHLVHGVEGDVMDDV